MPPPGVASDPDAPASNTSAYVPVPRNTGLPRLAKAHLQPVLGGPSYQQLARGQRRKHHPGPSSSWSSSHYPPDRNILTAHPAEHGGPSLTHPHKQSLVPSQVFEPPEVIHPPSLDELIDRISRIYKESEDESGHLARLQLGKLLRIGKPHMEGAEATARAYLKRLLEEVTILGNRPKVSQLVCLVVSDRLLFSPPYTERSSLVRAAKHHTRSTRMQQTRLVVCAGQHARLLFRMMLCREFSLRTSFVRNQSAQI